MPKVNRWMGVKFRNWIEAKIVEKKGWEFVNQYPPADFSLLLKYAQQSKFTCPEYEYKILNDLRAHGLPVEHQVIYLNRFIADIAIPELRVILELDGPYHRHQNQQMKDKDRKELFMMFGFTYHQWQMPMSEMDYQRKLGCFVKAYAHILKPYPLKPIKRPPAVEKATSQGLVQKALNLKKRFKKF